MSNDILKAVYSSIRKRRLSISNRTAHREIKDVKTRAKYYDKLCEEGLIKDCDGENMTFRHFVECYQSFKISTEQLPALRRVFGMVQDDKNYSIRDSYARLIDVNLSCGTEVDNAMKFYYITELPADSKCQIVKQSYDTIACGI